MEPYSSYLGTNLTGDLEFRMGLPPICQRMKGKGGLKRDENAGASALRRTNLYVGTVISRKTRQEKAGALLVFQKRFAEIRCEESFFFSRLSIKTEQNNREGEQTAILAYGECCANYTY